MGAAALWMARLLVAAGAEFDVRRGVGVLNRLHGTGKVAASLSFGPRCKAEWMEFAVKLFRRWIWKMHRHPVAVGNVHGTVVVSS